MNKIYLISLPSPFEEEPAMDIPLGIGYIISYLKSKGILGSSIKYIDFNTKKYDYYNDVKYLEEIPINVDIDSHNNSRDIYGISLTTPQYFWFYQICSHIRKNISRRPRQRIIIAGGPHASARPLECLYKDGIQLADFIIIGEGEETFYDIVTGKYDKSSYNSNGNRRIIKNLDTLPFPDRSVIDVNNYHRTINGNKAFHMITSRDCPFDCSFCSKKAVGRLIRYRTVNNIIKEIDYNILKYNVRNIVFYDDTFTVNKERAKSIAVELGKRKIIWRCFSRTDTVDLETLKIFKDNGISSITFGVETFSDKMLKVYNKGTTSDKNKRAIAMCKNVGIPVRCSLIYGGPYETIDTLKETVDGIRDTQPDEWNIATFVPIPGSDIGDNPEKYDIKIYPDPFYLKYHRVGKSGMGEILIDISTMTPEEYIKNRKWFVDEIENVCTRKMIQDTIQDLRV